MSQSETYQPTLIIHGGAGAITRDNLPPELYHRYQESLRKYLISTQDLLNAGASSLDAACHAVSLLEDDPLFNCGRGSVFTLSGTIEMEASVMVATASHSGLAQGAIKRVGAVSLVRNTRHPILLAREVLLDADSQDGLGGTNTMHCHLSGREVEEWGWRKKGLEERDDDWFWTKKRWEEHRRGLERPPLSQISSKINASLEAGDPLLPSQGTVGAVCFDIYGSMAVATSTGGLTNKAPGRIGDTPTIGAGFWAESWDATATTRSFASSRRSDTGLPLPGKWTEAAQRYLPTVIADCVPSLLAPRALGAFEYARSTATVHANLDKHQSGGQSDRKPSLQRAVAMSGTGNGDSFLRVNAARSAAAMCRLSRLSLQQAVTAVAGPGGELQRSAGDRWDKTGEGQGGIIGIEQSNEQDGDGLVRHTARLVFDFNCGGLWRAYYAKHPVTGDLIPTVMVFREEY